MRKIFLGLISIVSFSTNSIAQQSSSNPAAAFSPVGTWRGEFTFRPGVLVPFNFEVRNSGKSARLFLINGPEQFETGDIRLAGDSMFVPLDQFDNELAFKVENNKLNGVFRKQDKSGSPLPVTAEKGNKRFKESGVAPKKDISGSYDLLFASNGKTDSAVGLFKQDGKKLTATVLRVTGDSRYLEGTVEGNRFYLSSFIGSGPSYFQGTIDDQGKLTGEQVGIRSSTPFIANPNENASLPDAYSLTYLKNGYSNLSFSFPDVSGKTVSLSDERFKGKVVIVTIGGTWCPNCMDEAAFLAPWYKQNRDRGVEVISLQYERQTDQAYVQKVLNRFINRFDVKYPVLFGGTADKNYVATSLPALNNFLSFPTTLFIDKKGQVAKIHTGFSGPATGKFYDDFKKEFNHEVDTLLKQ